MVTFAVDPPAPSKLTRKALLCIKARPDTKEPGFPTGVQNEVVFMEMNKPERDKPIIDNLFNSCQVSTRIYF